MFTMFLALFVTFVHVSNVPSQKENIPFQMYSPLHIHKTLKVKISASLYLISFSCLVSMNKPVARIVLSKTCW